MLADIEILDRFRYKGNLYVIEDIEEHRIQGQLSLRVVARQHTIDDNLCSCAGQEMTHAAHDVRGLEPKTVT